MSALTRYLSEGLSVRAGVRVQSVSPSAGGLSLVAEDGAALGTFAQVVVATPAAQAAPLLSASPGLAAAAAGSRMDPCLAAMVTVEPAAPAPLDGAWVEDSPLSWVARNASKPGRPGADSWVLHASHDWSAAHLELRKPEIAERLWAAFCAALGGAPGARVEAVGHRWRYAIPRGPYFAEPLWDASVGLGACGDWCVGPRVEAAWLSGRALARAIIGGA